MLYEIESDDDKDYDNNNKLLHVAQIIDRK
jgi:hypothetical protein